MKLFETEFTSNRLEGGALAHSQLKSISEYSQKTSDLFGPTEKLPDWVQVELAEIQQKMHKLFHDLDAQTFAKLGDSPSMTTGDEIEAPEEVDLLFDAEGEEPEEQTTPPEEVKLLDDKPKTPKKEESEDEEDEDDVE